MSLIRLALKIAILVWIWSQMAGPAKRAGRSPLLWVIFGWLAFYFALVTVGFGPYFLGIAYESTTRDDGMVDTAMLKKIILCSLPVGLSAGWWVVRSMRKHLERMGLAKQPNQ